mgnify:CR=1 FL=1
MNILNNIEDMVQNTKKITKEKGKRFDKDEEESRYSPESETERDTVRFPG